MRDIFQSLHKYYEKGTQAWIFSLVTLANSLKSNYSVSWAVIPCCHYFIKIGTKYGIYPIFDHLLNYLNDHHVGLCVGNMSLQINVTHLTKILGIARVHRAISMGVDTPISLPAAGPRTIPNLIRSIHANSSPEIAIMASAIQWSPKTFEMEHHS